MNTTIKPLSESTQRIESNGIKNQILMRQTPLGKWLSDPFLSDRLSGTLRKNARIGFKHINQLEHEAICQTLGYGFEIRPTTYITFNDAITEGDCHSITEVGWHIDRMLNIHPFDEDIFELKYIVVKDQMGNDEKQGVGVILKETSIQWIKPGSLCFAILTEFDPKSKEWTECINPF